MRCVSPKLPAAKEEASKEEGEKEESEKDDKFISLLKEPALPILKEVL